MISDPTKKGGGWPEAIKGLKGGGNANQEGKGHNIHVASLAGGGMEKENTKLKKSGSKTGDRWGWERRAEGRVQPPARVG